MKGKQGPDPGMGSEVSWQEHPGSPRENGEEARGSHPRSRTCRIEGGSLRATSLRSPGGICWLSLPFVNGSGCTTRPLIMSTGEDAKKFRHLSLNFLACFQVYVQSWRRRAHREARAHPEQASVSLQVSPGPPSPTWRWACSIRPTCRQGGRWPCQSNINGAKVKVEPLP